MLLALLQWFTRPPVAAEARSAPISPADHAVFDRIRPEPADHTAVRTSAAKPLNDARVWWEILRSPVAPRDRRTPARRVNDVR